MIVGVLFVLVTLQVESDDGSSGGGPFTPQHAWQLQYQLLRDAARMSPSPIVTSS